MIRSETSSPISILRSESSTVSTEPDTSPLRMRLSWVFSPSFIRSRIVSRVGRPRLSASSALRSRACRRSAIWRATRSSGTTRKLSPASGTLVNPSTCTGRAGPASATGSPCSSSIARTRPKASPATTESPTRRVPRWTRTVATGPRPRSRRPSIATPWASTSVGARMSSAASAVRMTASSNPSMLVRLRADTSTNMASPPYSSATNPYSVSCPRTFCGSAPSLSILLTATTMGTSAAWA